MRCTLPRPSARLPLRGSSALSSLSLGALALGAFALSDRAAADEYVLGQVQVQLHAGVSVETINARYNTATLKSLDPLYLLAVPEGSTEDGLIQSMETDPDVKEIEYAWEGETPEGTRAMVVAAVGGTITEYLDQNVVGRLHLSDIQSHTTGEGVIVAVIDGGVLASHPGLDGVVLPGYDFVADDDDPADEGNQIDDDGDLMVDEGAGHGTMIAGIVHLVAPGAQILPIRVLDDEGRGDTFTVAQGIRYAIEHGADVINLSLGLDSNVFSLRHEVELANASGITVVGAAGNQSAQSLLYPAREDVCISVTALDSIDVKAGFSNFHQDVIVSAPGDGIFAPFYDGQWAIGAGTSFASPFVAGQAALIRALNPGLSTYGVRQAVKNGVVPVDQLPGNAPFQGKLGTGRFDGLATFLATPAAAGVTEVGAGIASVMPNPSRHGESVWFARTTSDERDLRLYDSSGRFLRSLSGRGSIEWDGRDARGHMVSVGTYFARSIGSEVGIRIVRLAR